MRIRARPCSLAVEHPLGKGEVTSSILVMGSTFHQRKLESEKRKADRWAVAGAKHSRDVAVSEDRSTNVFRVTEKSESKTNS